jgi:hypothetical protein
MVILVAEIIGKIFQKFSENCQKFKNARKILEHKNLRREFLDSKEFRKNANMPCHAMHPKQDYFRKDFYMQGWFDMQSYMHYSKLAKFYHCKNRVLHQVSSACGVDGEAPTFIFNRLGHVLWVNSAFTCMVFDDNSEVVVLIGVLPTWAPAWVHLSCPRSPLHLQCSSFMQSCFPIPSGEDYN